MRESGFMENLKAVVQSDPRYDMEAYIFVREALDFTITDLKKPDDGPDRHISGAQLADGFRRYALQEFGPIALKVLNSWGLRCTNDIGEIVFNLVESGELGKREEDSKADFDSLYDFEEAFGKPFLPESPAGDAGAVIP